MVKKPVNTAIITAVLVIIGIILFRPENPNRTGINARWFRFQKLQWHQQADIVIAGDSRAMCDLSPSEMGTAMPSMRILNFSFLSNAFTRNYLARTREILDPCSKSKTIIIGVSPQAFTKHAAKIIGSTFKRKKIRSPILLWMAKSYFEVCERFDTLVDFSAKKDYLFQEHYSPDGWLASDRIPPKSDGVLKHYRELFSREKVSKSMQSDFIDFVRNCSINRIKVVAFRPPVDPELRKVEDTLSGFDESSFISDFEAAGGTWIPCLSSNLKTYDGHHLTRTCAVEFSRSFALELAQACKNKSNNVVVSTAVSPGPESK